MIRADTLYPIITHTPTRYFIHLSLVPHGRAAAPARAPARPAAPEWDARAAAGGRRRAPPHPLAGRSSLDFRNLARRHARTHAHTHARTHDARTDARTHGRTHGRAHAALPGSQGARAALLLQTSPRIT